MSICRDASRVSRKVAVETWWNRRRYRKAVFTCACHAGIGERFQPCTPLCLPGRTPPIRPLVGNDSCPMERKTTLPDDEPTGRFKDERLTDGPERKLSSLH